MPSCPGPGPDLSCLGRYVGAPEHLMDPLRKAVNLSMQLIAELPEDPPKVKVPAGEMCCRALVRSLGDLLNTMKATCNPLSLSLTVLPQPSVPPTLACHAMASFPLHAMPWPHSHFMPCHGLIRLPLFIKCRSLIRV